MNRDISHSVQVVKREEKEAQLVQFMLAEIAAGRVSVTGEWRVVALSMESPVLVAIQRVLRDLGGADHLGVRVVLTACKRHVVRVMDVGGAEFTVRAAQNSRLLDAHEQLVLAETSSWTGDCMRRDPRERDAFETFGRENEQLASWAGKSFERLWQNASPVSGLARATKMIAGEDRLGKMPPAEGVKTTTLVAATSRH